MVFSYYSRPVISHNTFIGNHGDGIWIAFESTDRTIIKNNIIVRNDGYGIYRWGQDSSVATYNDVCDNSLGNYYGLLPGPGSLSVDPLFCDTAISDFSLASTSPCIGTGENGVNMGALGIGCALPAAEQPQVTNINIGEYEDSLHITNHTPVFAWRYFDPQSRPLTKSELQVGTDNDWSTAEMWEPPVILSPDTSITYAGLPLLDGSTYYVRIRVHNDTIWGNWKVAAFRLNSAPSIPSLNAPANGSIVNTSRPTLRVNNSSDAEGDPLHYDFTVYADSNLSTLVTFVSGINQGSGQTAWKTDSLQNENARHWWRARATDGFETGDWCAAWSFWVNAINDPPSPFGLAEPANGTIVAAYSLLLKWEKSHDQDPGQGAVVYDLHLSIDSLFNFVSITTGIQDTSINLIDELSWATRYWWKVKATDQGGGQTWSDEVFTFRTVTLGDANGNGLVNIADVVYLISYIFSGGPAPVPLFAGDANCNGLVNIADVVYLIAYVFSGGPEPCY